MTKTCNSDGLTIDASALYALSAPDVPQEARDEAVERAEAGERISKADASWQVYLPHKIFSVAGTQRETPAHV